MDCFEKGLTLIFGDSVYLVPDKPFEVSYLMEGC